MYNIYMFCMYISTYISYIYMYHKKARENGSENRYMSRVRSAAKRECEP